MKGIIRKINYTRSLAIFEDEDGDYGYFEILGENNLEIDNEIIGNLHNLGEEKIIKTDTNQDYEVFIEDFGMSLQQAIEQCF